MELDTLSFQIHHDTVAASLWPRGGGNVCFDIYDLFFQIPEFLRAFPYSLKLWQTHPAQDP